MNKKSLWKFIIVLFCIFAIGIFSGDNLDYARITDMEYKAVVVDEPNSQGKIVVTERITFDVHAASRDNGFWELWRDLCEDWVDGVRVHYKVNSVKQILPDGTKISWDESPKLYWDDSDYESWNSTYGPGKWYHSPGPYNEAFRDYEAVFFYVDNLYREKVTFEIEYEMYNAVLRYGDCSDLYISMFSGSDIKHLESMNVDILIPEKDMPSNGNYTATALGTNSGTIEFNESTNKNPGYHTFSFELDEEDLKFKPYNEYIEFDLIAYGDDKHIFADYASENYYYNDAVLDEAMAEMGYYIYSPEIFAIVKTVILGICILISIIVVICGLKKIKSANKRDFNITQYETFRDIPSDLDPKFAAALVACKDKKAEDDSSVYSAILLSLARKGYIEISGTLDDDVGIYIKEEISPVLNDAGEVIIPVEEIDFREPLTKSEKLYLDLIKHHVNTNYISMNDLQDRIASDYDYTSNFVRNLNKSVVDNGVNLGYFEKANYLELKQKLMKSANTHKGLGWILIIIINSLISLTRLDFVFGGLVILGVTCILVGRYIEKHAYDKVLLTELGEQEYAKWRGLYNFLNSDTLINERTYIELPLWERYLVYATAFGISEKVIEAIKIRCPQEVYSNSIIYNDCCRSHRIRHHGHRFHSSVRYGSHRHSSGGSFGYGFSGGRGGGGGGGGH